MSLVQIYLDAVTHQVITNEELAYVAGNQDRFDRTELKLTAPSRLSVLGISVLERADHPKKKTLKSIQELPHRSLSRLKIIRSCDSIARPPISLPDRQE